LTVNVAVVVHVLSDSVCRAHWDEDQGCLSGWSWCCYRFRQFYTHCQLCHQSTKQGKKL